jgi:hypothetical protein
MMHGPCGANPMHGRRQMQKAISMQVPIWNGDGCKRISYLLMQKYVVHTFGSWRLIGQSLGGTTQCLFVNQIQLTHQCWGLQQHSCSQVSVQVYL